MAILFSTAYEGSLFKDDKNKEHRYVGILTLLSLFERELGLFQEYPSNEFRLKAYLDSLKECSKDAFYSASFESDSFNVAKELLQLRDELVFAGWSSDFMNQPKRLSDFAKVDTIFKQKDKYLGIPDRWLRVTDELTTEKINTISLDIQVDDNFELLYPILQIVLTKVNAKKNNQKSIVLTESNLSKFQYLLSKSIFNKEINEVLEFDELENDKSLIILKFKNQQELTDSIAYWANKEEHIIVASNNIDLDFSLVSFGKEASGSFQTNSNPQLVQLYKLVIPCFSNQFNIQTFLSFLQLKYSPLPFELKSKILKCVNKTPGVGNENWKTIISEFISGDIDSKTDLTTKERKTIIELFLSFETLEETEAVNKANRIINFLINWCETSLKSNVKIELREQFNYLRELFTRTIDLIQNENNINAIENAFQTIYSAGNFTSYVKQEESILCINDFSKIIEECSKSIIVSDFYGSFTSRDISKFLLVEEQNYLRKNNAFFNFYAELETEQLSNGINKAKKQLILCVIENQLIEKHPFHIRLETLFSESYKKIEISITNLRDFEKLDIDFFKVNPLIESAEIIIPSAKAYFESNLLSLISKRETESASSIEKLIQYPFEWVLAYILNMRSYQGLSFSRENELKGNIAHKIIENIFSQKISDLFIPIDVSTEILNNEFNKVIQQEGIMFLQPEKRFELLEFKQRLFNSITTLIEIINLNEFNIFACEKAFGKETPCFIEEVNSNVVGYIDLVLKNKEGNYFVIDLKWTFSDKKFVEKIDKNEAIQLSLYAAALGDKDLTQSGYFLLNQNILVTAANLKGNFQKVGNEFSNQLVLDKIKKSIEFRLNEFRVGKLEIGDTILLTELDYNQIDGLINLVSDKKVKELHKYSRLDLFKGNLN